MIKFFLITLAVIVLLIVAFIYLPSFFTGYYTGPVSAHFDGKKFHNPGEEAASKSTFASLINIIKWRFDRNRPVWPEQVVNLPHAEITTSAPLNTIKITFIGHATTLIQTPELNILTDPIFSERASPVSWYGPKRVRQPGIKMDELPPINVVLISHNHYDHMDITSLKKLEERFHPTFLVPLGDKQFLLNRGMTNVIEMDWWQQYQAKQIVITFLPAKHWSARWLSDRNRTFWGSYGIENAGKKIYFAGDTGYSLHFKLIHEKWGQPDLAILPIGAYVPRWMMSQNHINPQEAVKASIDLQAKQSLAIHFGTFQLGDEGFNQPIADLKKAMEELSNEQNQFLVLPEGRNILI